MSITHGTFVWYELMTTDTKAAHAFYRDVIGWHGQDANVPGQSYTILTIDGIRAAGLMALPDEAYAAGGRPAWIGYVAVDDVDAGAAKAGRLGGAVHRPPSDIPGIGRFAVIGDPQGALLALFKGIGPEPPPVAPDAPGHAGWRELRTTDQDAAFPFYAELFGWTKADAMDMGPMGTYQLFAAHGDRTGAMMRMPPGSPAPYWLYYFNVADIDAAAARVRSGGGQVMLEPQPVPDGRFVINGRDPQGASIAFVGPRLT